MNKKEIVSGLAVILVVALLSAYLLAQVYDITKPRIEEQRRIEEERINRELLPAGEIFKEAEKNGMKYTEVFDGKGEKLGRIFQAVQSGYGGPVVMRICIGKDMKVKGVRILEHRETPGLGSRITEASFLKQFEGKRGNSLYLKKYHSEGEIDAVTGATVSSQAVSEGIIKLKGKIR